MKRDFLKTVQTLLIVISLGLSQNIFSQPPPPPGGASGTGDGGGSSSQANGAPIGGGLFILLGLGAVYGGKKFYDSRKERMEE